jgi:hypothetical protein
MLSEHITAVGRASAKRTRSSSALANSALAMWSA